MCGSRREPLTRGPDPGGTLIFSYIQVIFWIKILNFNIFGSFQKNEYFLDLNSGEVGALFNRFKPSSKIFY